MGRDYYTLWYRLDRADRYALWYSSEPDYVCGVLIDEEGLAPNFSNCVFLRDYASQHSIVVKEEPPILHDIDVVRRWLDRPRKDTVICTDFLAAWNLFEDVCTAVGDTPLAAKFRQTRPRWVANKLFWGNNLPVVTPLGRRYEPIWTKSEVGIMQYVLGEGLAEFRRRFVTREN